MHRSFNLNDFFDEGKRTEVDPGGVDGFNVELATYGALQWSCWWISEDAYVEIKAPGDETAYSILALDIISMKDVTTVEFECLNSEGETVGMVEAKLQPGKNIVNLEQYMSADIIRIYNGESIAFKSVWFWEKEREKVDISFAVGFFISFAVWLFLGKLFKRVRPCNNLFECWIHGLTSLYQKFTDLIYRAIPMATGRCRRWVRRLIICLFSVVNIYINNSYGISTDVYKWLLAIGVITVVLLACVSIEGKTEPVNWNTTGGKAWFAFAVLVLISEVFVAKRFYGVGLLLLFGLPFLFYVINNMEQPRDFVIDIVRSVEILFVLQLVFCLMFRPLIQGVRYCGIANGPGIYGGYALIAESVLLSETVEQIKRQKKVGEILSVMGCVADFFLIWQTQSLADVSVGVLLIVFWFYRVFRMERLSTLRKICLLFEIGVLGVGIFCGLKWGLENIPYIVGYPLVFPKDAYATEIGGIFGTMNVEAAEIVEYVLEQTRIGQKIKNMSDLKYLSSGRVEIYLESMKDVNLLGHERGIILSDGAEYLTHNGILEMAYRYGIFSAVPYIIIMLTSIKMSFLEFVRQKKEHSFFGFALTIAMISITMVDNIERPYRWLSWYMLYFALGSYALADAGRKKK